MKVKSYSIWMIALVLFVGAGIFLVYLPYDTKFDVNYDYNGRGLVGNLTTIGDSTTKGVSGQLVETQRSDGKASHPKILIWAKPNTAFVWTFPQFENGDGGCELIYDRNQLEKADAVAFFMKTCRPNDRPDPKRRRHDQAYVWWSMESPWTVRNYYHYKLTEYNNYFNWTMVGHTDSDVLAAFWPSPAMDYLLLKLGRTNEMVDKNLASKILPGNEFMVQIKELLNRKSKLVAWIASDCNMTPMAKKRKEIVLAIGQQGGFEIDRYGRCGGKSLPHENSNTFRALSSYKFYMAFENSIHCRGYLTEKSTYNSLVSCTVPIIYGPTKEEAVKLMPRRSYIHVEDFDNLTALANYLKYLDKNDTAYMEYFSWWKDPGAATYPRFGFNFGPSYLSLNSSLRHIPDIELQENWRDFIRFGLYHLCRKLKRGDHITTSKTIPDLAHKWYGTENERCLGGK